MFNEDFYLPLYLPPWYRRTYYINTAVQRQERSMKKKGEGIVAESEEVGKGVGGGMDLNKTTAKKEFGLCH